MPELLAEVNARVREIAQASSYDGVEPWDFYCECGTPGCKERVTISLADYEALKESVEPVLAPGHAQPPVVRSRAMARELLKQAKALQGQAR